MTTRSRLWIAGAAIATLAAAGTYYPRLSAEVNRAPVDLAGVALGVGAAWALSTGLSWAMAVSPRAVALSFGCAFAIGGVVRRS